MQTTIFLYQFEDAACILAKRRDPYVIKSRDVWAASVIVTFAGDAYVAVQSVRNPESPPLLNGKTPLPESPNGYRMASRAGPGLAIQWRLD
jgi:hypothetical protein